jgi:hypothetical protein
MRCFTTVTHDIVVIFEMLHYVQYDIVYSLSLYLAPGFIHVILFTNYTHTRLGLKPVG